MKLANLTLSLAIVYVFFILRTFGDHTPKVVSLSVADACCGTTGFQSANQTCCNGTVVEGVGVSCCGRQGYNTSQFICCNETLLPLPEDGGNNSLSCCGSSVLFDPSSKCSRKTLIKLFFNVWFFVHS
jgi:hypothetical protein